MAKRGEGTKTDPAKLKRGRKPAKEKKAKAKSMVKALKPKKAPVKKTPVQPKGVPAAAKPVRRNASTKTTSTTQLNGVAAPKPKRAKKTKQPVVTAEAQATPGAKKPAWRLPAAVTTPFTYLVDAFRGRKR